MDILTQYLITFGWALTAAVSMAVAMSIGLVLFNFISPLDEWEEVRQGNMSMALILSAAIIGMSIVVAFAISG